MAKIAHSAIFSPRWAGLPSLVPEAMFFKVFISSFSVGYKKFVNGG